MPRLSIELPITAALTAEYRGIHARIQEYMDTGRSTGICAHKPTCLLHKRAGTCGGPHNYIVSQQVLAVKRGTQVHN
jgi:hypothetical protein